MTNKQPGFRDIMNLIESALAPQTHAGQMAEAQQEIANLKLQAENLKQFEESKRKVRTEADMTLQEQWWALHRLP